MPGGARRAQVRRDKQTRKKEKETDELRDFLSVNLPENFRGVSRSENSFIIPFDSEYELRVSVSEIDVQVSTMDLQLGVQVTWDRLASTSVLGGWIWSSKGNLGVIRMSEEVLAEVRARYGSMPSGSFPSGGEQRQSYMLAKLASAKSVDRFVYFLDRVETTGHYGVLVRSIAQLHGGEIWRVYQNRLAARELVR